MKITTEILEEIARRLMNKINMERLTRDDEAFKDNKRFNPYHSERKGMEHTLKALGIEYEYEYNDEHGICAVVVSCGDETARHDDLN